MKTILVTGASSFLGHHVLPRLRENENLRVLAPSSKTLNLLDRLQVIDYIARSKPDIILHMAAKCGGIGANKNAPAQFVHDNLIMASNLFEAIRAVNQWGVARKPAPTGKGRLPAPIPVVTHFYGLGSVCAYPKFCPVPFQEVDIWNGYPEETNAPYGTAKRTLLVMQQAFRQQFGLKGAHLVPVNLYGPHDHFDLQDSHVIPALINKFISAKKQYEHDSQEAAVSPNTCPDITPTVEIWGDGTPTREFLYAGDCADAIVKAIVEEFDYTDPINLGTGQDISIYELAQLIREVVDAPCDLKFTGEVSVNGQPKRRLDVSRAKNVLGFEAKTALREGLKKTVDWYLENTQPNKEAQMTTEQTTNSDQATAEEKLTNLIELIETRTETLFDEINNDPTNTKKDYVLVKYLETLTAALEKVQKLKGEKPKNHKKGDCIQCQNPHFDGFCTCNKPKSAPYAGPPKNLVEEREALRKAAEEIQKAGVTEVCEDTINRMREAVKSIHDELGTKPTKSKVLENTDTIFVKAKQEVKLSDKEKERAKGLRQERRDAALNRAKQVIRGAGGRDIPQTDMQKLSAEIREAVGDPAKLKEIAKKIDEATPSGWKGLTSANREFFQSLISHLVFGEKVTDEDHMEHIEKIAEQGRQSAEKSNFKKVDHDHKVNVDLVRLENLAKSMVDRGLIDKDNVRLQVETMLTWPETSLKSIENALYIYQNRNEVCNNGDVSNAFQQTPDDIKYEDKISSETQEVVCNKGEKLNSGLDPVEALCRAGFTREQAERKVEEGKNKSQFKKIPVDLLMKSDVSEESVEEPELTQKPVELPKEPEVIKDLDFYIKIDRFKRQKADDAIKNGTGKIRRVGGTGKGSLKRIEILDEEFKDAIDNFQQKYGKYISKQRVKNVGVRYSDLAAPKNHITDTEIMAAKYVSDKIEPPTKELNTGNIACPKKNENEANKPDPAPEPKVGEEQLKAAVKKLYNDLGLDKETKVENPKKRTIIGRVKSAVKNIFKKVSRKGK